eukprot:1144115-Pelagomonas_calceolata.AAC.2
MILFTARFWSRVLPVALQIPISIFCLVASWWRGLMALLSQCVSSSLIDAGRVSFASVEHWPRRQPLLQFGLAGLIRGKNEYI